MDKVSISTEHAGQAVKELCDVIAESREELSRIDGATGDGDHGINMATGFALYGAAANEAGSSIAAQLELLGMTLLEQTGGSLGPLYGGMFIAMAEQLEGKEAIEPQDLLSALCAGRDSITEIGGAQRGDKTMLDSLGPAIEAYANCLEKGDPFPVALEALGREAAAGLESTRDMVARVGRASRLGERSRGTLDAGAASCSLILNSLARSFQTNLNSTN